MAVWIKRIQIWCGFVATGVMKSNHEKMPFTSPFYKKVIMRVTLLWLYKRESWRCPEWFTHVTKYSSEHVSCPWCVFISIGVSLNGANASFVFKTMCHRAHVKLTGFVAWRRIWVSTRTSRQRAPRDSSPSVIKPCRLLACLITHLERIAWETLDVLQLACRAFDRWTRAALLRPKPCNDV